MSGYTSEERPCCDCDKVLRVWRYRGAYSHVGGEGPRAALLAEGYICDGCNRERWRTKGMLVSMDGLVNG